MAQDIFRVGLSDGHRTQVANISDAGYVGCAKTVAYLAPLLQSPTTNPHATLITFFMNAVQEMVGPDAREDLEQEVRKLAKYMPDLGARPSMYGARMMVMMASGALVRDVDKYFNRYILNTLTRDPHADELQIHGAP